jgi:hypothetical protein
MTDVGGHWAKCGYLCCSKEQYAQQSICFVHCWDIFIGDLLSVLLCCTELRLVPLYCYFVVLCCCWLCCVVWCCRLRYWIAVYCVVLCCGRSLLYDLCPVGVCKNGNTIDEFSSFALTGRYGRICCLWLKNKRHLKTILNNSRMSQ